MCPCCARLVRRSPWLPLRCIPVAASLRAQSAQTPVFRSGVELLEVDVLVVDGNSRPVTDLQTPEFVVSIDGQPRRVVSSEFVSDLARRRHGPSGACRPVHLQQHRPPPRSFDRHRHRSEQHDHGAVPQRARVDAALRPGPRAQRSRGAGRPAAARSAGGLHDQPRADRPGARPRRGARRGRSRAVRHQQLRGGGALAGH